MISKQTNIEVQLTFFPVAFPVKIFLSPEEVKVLTGQEADYGMNTVELFQRFYLNMSSLKIHLNSQKKALKKSYMTFPKSGMMQNGKVFFASEFGKYHHRERLYILAYPSTQRRKGILHSIKRSCKEKNIEADALGTQRNPFLQFHQSTGESAVLRMDDGIAKRLDANRRLGGCGNAVVKEIPLEIFKTIKEIELWQHLKN